MQPTTSKPSQRRYWFTYALYAGLIILLLNLLLPSEYTLCSKSHNIYTVDPEKPRVQCIHVRGSVIMDTGSLGMLGLNLLASKCPSSTQSAEIQSRLGPPNFLQALVRFFFIKDSLRREVIDLHPAYAVVPGFAGDFHCCLQAEIAMNDPEQTLTRMSLSRVLKCNFK